VGRHARTALRRARRRPPGRRHRRCALTAAADRAVKPGGSGPGGLLRLDSVPRGVRRALLKAFGFTQFQLASAVSWQASVAAVIGIVFGVPIGIVAGRWLWILFARAIYAVPCPSVPVLDVVVIALGTLVLANVAALIPGRMAARTPTALVLRAE
jgi:hypothetical protein